MFLGTVEDSIFTLEEISKVQAVSVNFDEVLPQEQKKIYIPRMIHPWKRDSFEKFREKQNTKLHKELQDVSQNVKNLVLKNKIFRANVKIILGNFLK